MEGRTSLTEDELEILKKSGWTVTRLATLDGCGDDALGAVIWKLQQRDEEVTIDKSRLAELVKLCAVCAQARHQTDAKRGSQDLMDAHASHRAFPEKLLPSSFKSNVNIFAFTILHRDVHARGEWEL